MSTTSASTNLTVPGPAWVVAEMPPGYRNRVGEIQRIIAELESMGQFGRLLYEVGPALGEVVRNLFVALKFETDAMPGAPSSAIAVRLDARRRLLLHPAAATGAIEKRGAEIAQVFQLMHEVAEDADRVVLITNAEPTRPPADRAVAVTPDALAFLERMGAGHVAASTLFDIWKLSLGDHARARAQVDRLYSAPPGTFELPASATR